MLVGTKSRAFECRRRRTVSRRRSSKRKRRACAPPLPSSPCPGDLRNSLSTACCAWFEIDKAEIDNCWRVCRVSRFALSRFWSARTRLSDPVCSVLTRFLVKSARVWMVEELVPRSRPEFARRQAELIA